MVSRIIKAIRRWILKRFNRFNRFDKFRKIIEEEVARGELRTAVQRIIEYNDVYRHPYSKSATMTLAKINFLEMSVIKGTITDKEIRIEKLKIVESILMLTDMLERYLKAKS